jgi:hypothetical protein
MLARVCTPSSLVREREWEGERERKREGGRERKRKREGGREREKERGRESEREKERKKEGERERERERERVWLLNLKEMTGALAPFSYLVLKECS